MIETTPLAWEVLNYHDQGAVTCFNPGCQRTAAHRAKIRVGEVIAQICLCNSCVRETQEDILGAALGLQRHKDGVTQ